MCTYDILNKVVCVVCMLFCLTIKIIMKCTTCGYTPPIVVITMTLECSPVISSPVMATTLMLYNVLADKPLNT